MPLKRYPPHPLSPCLVFFASFDMHPSPDLSRHISLVATARILFKFTLATTLLLKHKQTDHIILYGCCVSISEVFN